MFNEYFFILLSFIMVVVFAFKPCKKALIEVMEKYSQGVLSSIVEAEKIRREAEVELSKMKKKAATINIEIDKMIAEAKKESQFIMDGARIQAENILAKRTKIAMQRISQQEINIHKTIRDELVAHVLRAVEISLATKTDEKTKQELMANSLNNAKKLIH